MSRMDEQRESSQPAERHAGAPEKGTSFSVHAALLSVQLSFAAAALVGKIVMNVEHVDPTALAFLRATGGAVAFQIARVAVDRGRPPPSLRDHGGFALYAILGVVVNQAFFLHGLKHGTATSATLLIATIPVFTAAVAAAVGRERITLRSGAGIVVATSGVLLLTGVRNVSLGNVLVTINSLSYAAYMVGVGKLLRKHGTLTTVAWIFTYGALMLAPFGAGAVVHEAAGWSRRGVALVGFFIAVPTIFAYLANAWALSRARPSIVAAYVYLQPLLVMLFAGRLLGETFGTRTLLSAAAILVGVGIVATR